MRGEERTVRMIPRFLVCLPWRMEWPFSRGKWPGKDRIWPEENQQFCLGTSLTVQWLRLHASNAGTAGSNPGRATKIPHAAWRGQIKQRNKQTKNSSASSTCGASSGQLDATA